jgi:DNA-binding transcriptional LysR family regulator
VPIAELAGLPLLQEARDVPEWPGTNSLTRAPATIEEQLEHVASGAGFAVLPAGMADFYRRPDVTYVSLSGVAPRMVALAQSEHRMMPELEQFAAIAREMLGPRENR